MLQTKADIFAICCCTTGKQFMKMNLQLLKFRNDNTSVFFCQNENLSFIGDINDLWYQKKHPIQRECKIFDTVKYCKIACKSSSLGNHLQDETSGEDQPTGIIKN